MEKNQLQVGDKVYVVYGDLIINVMQIEKVSQEKALTDKGAVYRRDILEDGRVRLFTETSLSLQRHFVATEEWNKKLIRQMDIRFITSHNFDGVKSEVVRKIAELIIDPKSKISQDESVS